MSAGQVENSSDTKQDDTLKPISPADLIEPTEILQKTSAEREWKIKNFQEKLGVSRDIAERMVDESGGAG
jgi:hypothetical protein